MEKIPSNEKPFKTLLYSFLVTLQIMINSGQVFSQNKKYPVEKVSHIDLREQDSEKLELLKNSLKKYGQYVERYLGIDPDSINDLNDFAQATRRQVISADSLIKEKFPENSQAGQTAVPVLSLFSTTASTYVEGVYYERDSAKISDYALICLFHFLRPHLFTGTHETWHQLEWQYNEGYLEIYKDIVGSDKNLFKKVGEKLYPFVEKVKFNEAILANLDSDFVYLTKEIESQGEIEEDQQRIFDYLILNMLISYNRGIKAYVRSDKPEDVQLTIKNASEEIALHFLSKPEFLPFLMQYKAIIENKYLNNSKLTISNIEEIKTKMKSPEDLNQIESLFLVFTEEQLEKLLKFAIRIEE